MQQFFLNVVRSAQMKLQPPVETLENIATPRERAMAASMTSVTLMGDKSSIQQQLSIFQEKYNVDEIMAVSYIYNREKQKRSYEILKEVVDGQ